MSFIEKYQVFHAGILGGGDNVYGGEQRKIHGKLLREIIDVIYMFVCKIKKKSVTEEELAATGVDDKLNYVATTLEKINKSGVPASAGLDKFANNELVNSISDQLKVIYGSGEAAANEFLGGVLEAIPRMTSQVISDLAEKIADLNAMRTAVGITTKDDAKLMSDEQKVLASKYDRIIEAYSKRVDDLHKVMKKFVTSADKEVASSMGGHTIDAIRKKFEAKEAAADKNGKQVLDYIRSFSAVVLNAKKLSKYLDKVEISESAFRKAMENHDMQGLFAQVEAKMERMPPVKRAAMQKALVNLKKFHRVSTTAFGTKLTGGDEQLPEQLPVQLIGAVEGTDIMGGKLLGLNNVVQSLTKGYDNGYDEQYKKRVGSLFLEENTKFISRLIDAAQEGAVAMSDNMDVSVQEFIGKIKQLEGIKLGDIVDKFSSNQSFDSNFLRQQLYRPLEDISRAAQAVAIKNKSMQKFVSVMAEYIGFLKAQEKKHVGVKSIAVFGASEVIGGLAQMRLDDIVKIFTQGAVVAKMKIGLNQSVSQLATYEQPQADMIKKVVGKQIEMTNHTFADLMRKYKHHSTFPVQRELFNLVCEHNREGMVALQRAAQGLDEMVRVYHADVVKNPQNAKKIVDLLKFVTVDAYWLADDLKNCKSVTDYFHTESFAVANNEVTPIKMYGGFKSDGTKFDNNGQEHDDASVLNQARIDTLFKADKSIDHSKNAYLGTNFYDKDKKSFTPFPVRIGDCAYSDVSTLAITYCEKLKPNAIDMASVKEELRKVGVDKQLVNYYKGSRHFPAKVFMRGKEVISGNQVSEYGVSATNEYDINPEAGSTRELSLTGIQNAAGIPYDIKFLNTDEQLRMYIAAKAAVDKAVGIVGPGEITILKNLFSVFESIGKQFEKDSGKSGKFSMMVGQIYESMKIYMANTTMYPIVYEHQNFDKDAVFCAGVALRKFGDDIVYISGSTDVSTYPKLHNYMRYIGQNYHDYHSGEIDYKDEKIGEGNHRINIGEGKPFVDTDTFRTTNKANLHDDYNDKTNITWESVVKNRAFADCYFQHDNLSVMMLKSIFTKIMGTLSMYKLLNMSTDPSNMASNKIRAIYGGNLYALNPYSQAPVVKSEYTEAYVRMFLLSKFYKNILFTDNYFSEKDQRNVKGIVAARHRFAVIPLGGGRFDEMMRIVFVKNFEGLSEVDASKSGMLKNEIMHDFVREINVLMDAGKGTPEERCQSLILDYIKDVNGRYGVVNSKDIKTYMQREKKELYPLLFDDADTSKNFDHTKIDVNTSFYSPPLLDGEGTDPNQSVVPSDMYVGTKVFNSLAMDKDESTIDKYNISWMTALVYNFRKTLDDYTSQLSSRENSRGGTNASAKEGVMSTNSGLRYRIAGIKRAIDERSYASDKMGALIESISGLGNNRDQSVTPEVYALKELVISPLSLLFKIYVRLSAHVFIFGSHKGSVPLNCNLNIYNLGSVLTDLVGVYESTGDVKLDFSKLANTCTNFLRQVTQNYSMLASEILESKRDELGKYITWMLKVHNKIFNNDGVLANGIKYDEIYFNPLIEYNDKLNFIPQIGTDLELGQPEDVVALDEGETFATLTANVTSDPGLVAYGNKIITQLREYKTYNNESLELNIDDTIYTNSVPINIKESDVTMLGGEGGTTFKDPPAEPEEAPEAAQGNIEAAAAAEPEVREAAQGNIGEEAAQFRYYLGGVDNVSIIDAKKIKYGSSLKELFPAIADKGVLIKEISKAIKTIEEESKQRVKIIDSQYKSPVGITHGDALVTAQLLIDADNTTRANVVEQQELIVAAHPEGMMAGLMRNNNNRNNALALIDDNQQLTAHQKANIEKVAEENATNGGDAVKAAVEARINNITETDDKTIKTKVKDAVGVVERKAKIAHSEEIATLRKYDEMMDKVANYLKQILVSKGGLLNQRKYTEVVTDNILNDWYLTSTNMRLDSGMLQALTPHFVRHRIAKKGESPSPIVTFGLLNSRFSPKNPYLLFEYSLVMLYKVFYEKHGTGYFKLFDRFTMATKSLTNDIDFVDIFTGFNKDHSLKLDYPFSEKIINLYRAMAGMSASGKEAPRPEYLVQDITILPETYIEDLKSFLPYFLFNIRYCIQSALVHSRFIAADKYYGSSIASTTINSNDFTAKKRADGTIVQIIDGDADKKLSTNYAEKLYGKDKVGIYGAAEVESVKLLMSENKKLLEYWNGIRKKDLLFIKQDPGKISLRDNDSAIAAVLAKGYANSAELDEVCRVLQNIINSNAMRAVEESSNMSMSIVTDSNSAFSDKSRYFYYQLLCMLGSINVPMFEKMITSREKCMHYATHVAQVTPAKTVIEGLVSGYCNGTNSGTLYLNCSPYGFLSEKNVEKYYNVIKYAVVGDKQRLASSLSDMRKCCTIDSYLCLVENAAYIASIIKAVNKVHPMKDIAPAILQACDPSCHKVSRVFTRSKCKPVGSYTEESLNHTIRQIHKENPIILPEMVDALTAARSIQRDINLYHGSTWLKTIKHCNTIDPRIHSKYIIHDGQTYMRVNSTDYCLCGSKNTNFMAYPNADAIIARLATVYRLTDTEQGKYDKCQVVKAIATCGMSIEDAFTSYALCDHFIEHYCDCCCSAVSDAKDLSSDTASVAASLLNVYPGEFKESLQILAANNMTVSDSPYVPTSADGLLYRMYHADADSALGLLGQPDGTAVAYLASISDTADSVIAEARGVAGQSPRHREYVSELISMIEKRIGVRQGTSSSMRSTSDILVDLAKLYVSSLSYVSNEERELLLVAGDKHKLYQVAAIDSLANGRGRYIVSRPLLKSTMHSADRRRVKAMCASQCGIINLFTGSRKYCGKATSADMVAQLFNRGKAAECKDFYIDVPDAQPQFVGRESEILEMLYSATRNILGYSYVFQSTGDASDLATVINMELTGSSMPVERKKAFAASIGSYTNLVSLAYINSISRDKSLFKCFVCALMSNVIKMESPSSGSMLKPADIVDMQRSMRKFELSSTGEYSQYLKDSCIALARHLGMYKDPLTASDVRFNGRLITSQESCLFVANGFPVSLRLFIKACQPIQGGGLYIDEQTIKGLLSNNVSKRSVSEQPVPDFSTSFVGGVTISAVAGTDKGIKIDFVLPKKEMPDSAKLSEAISMGVLNKALGQYGLNVGHDDVPMSLNIGYHHKLTNIDLAASATTGISVVGYSGTEFVKIKDGNLEAAPDRESYNTSEFKIDSKESYAARALNMVKFGTLLFESLTEVMNEVAVVPTYMNTGKVTNLFGRQESKIAPMSFAVDCIPGLINTVKTDKTSPRYGEHKEKALYNVKVKDIMSNVQQFMPESLGLHCANIRDMHDLINGPKSKLFCMNSIFLHSDAMHVIDGSEFKSINYMLKDPAIQSMFSGKLSSADLVSFAQNFGKLCKYLYEVEFKSFSGTAFSDLNNVANPKYHIVTKLADNVLGTELSDFAKSELYTAGRVETSYTTPDMITKKTIVSLIAAVSPMLKTIGVDEYKELLGNYNKFVRERFMFANSTDISNYLEYDSNGKQFENYMKHDGITRGYRGVNAYEEKTVSGKQDKMLFADNILDIGVWPIDIHAMMREIPLSNMINNTYSFDCISEWLITGEREIDGYVADKETIIKRALLNYLRSPMNADMVPIPIQANKSLFFSMYKSGCENKSGCPPVRVKRLDSAEKYSPSVVNAEVGKKYLPKSGEFNSTDDFNGAAISAIRTLIGDDGLRDGKVATEIYKVIEPACNVLFDHPLSKNSKVADDDDNIPKKNSTMVSNQVKLAINDLVLQAGFAAYEGKDDIKKLSLKRRQMLGRIYYQTVFGKLASGGDNNVERTRTGCKLDGFAIPKSAAAAAPTKSAFADTSYDESEFNASEFNGTVNMEGSAAVGDDVAPPINPSVGMKSRKIKSNKLDLPYSCNAPQHMGHSFLEALNNIGPRVGLVNPYIDGKPNNGEDIEPTPEQQFVIDAAMANHESFSELKSLSWNAFRSLLIAASNETVYRDADIIDKLDITVVENWQKDWKGKFEKYTPNADTVYMANYDDRISNSKLGYLKTDELVPEYVEYSTLPIYDHAGSYTARVIGAEGVDAKFNRVTKQAVYKRQLNMDLGILLEGNYKSTILDKLVKGDQGYYTSQFMAKRTDDDWHHGVDKHCQQPFLATSIYAETLFKMFTKRFQEEFKSEKKHLPTGILSVM